MFGETQFNVNHSRVCKYIGLHNYQTEHPLVLLHGMFGGLSNFDPLLARIKQYPVLVPSIPVYELDKGRLNIPELSDWLDTFFNEMEITRPILLGNSMGGHIALQYALTHPDNVEALVLTGSSGLFENDLGSSCPKRYDRKYVKERASLTFYEDMIDDTIIDEILEVLQSSEKLSRLLRIARSTHQHNLESRLHEIGQPVLLVWGQNDIITPPEVANTFLSKLPNATLRWIDRCGHAPMMERPDEFYHFLAEFLFKHNYSGSTEKATKHEENYTHF